MPKFGTGAKKGATDFFQLSVAYAKQEALQPILRQAKALLRVLGGSVLMALGTVLLGLGFVRALQTEFAGGNVTGIAYAPLTGGYVPLTVTRFRPNRYGDFGHLSGDLSWVPYMGGALFCILVVGFCVMRVMKVAK